MCESALVSNSFQKVALQYGYPQLTYLALLSSVSEVHSPQWDLATLTYSFQTNVSS